MVFKGQLKNKDLFGTFVFTFNIMKTNVLRGVFAVVMLINTSFSDYGIWDVSGMRFSSW